MTVNWSRVAIEPIHPLLTAIPDRVASLFRTMATNPLGPKSGGVLLLLLASALILMALSRRFGATRSEQVNPSRKSPFSPRTPAPQASGISTIAVASTSTNAIPVSEKPALDLTRLNPETSDGVALYGFTPSEVSPETNAPMDPMKVGSEFFFLKERIGAIEDELKIKRPENGRFR